MSEHRVSVSEWELKVLNATEEIPETEFARNHPAFGPGNGWLNNVDVREFLASGSLETRTALERLAASGLLLNRTLHSARHYKISPAGTEFLKHPNTIDETVDSRNWTGIVSPVQAAQCLSIVSEMEDACERITNNQARAQIFGLIRALEILLTVPEPPRPGIVSLLRDPAFGNVTQVATFIAALIAAVRA